MSATAKPDADSNKIGQLNGPWSIMLRIALASYPLLIGWCVWVTVQQFGDIAYRSNSNHATRDDLSSLRQEIVEKMNDLPPRDWRDRIIIIEKNQAEIIRSLARVEAILENRK